jgi:SAM-dependent methyltransferase
MSSKQHWENVYSTKATDAVSWYQPQAELSLQMIAATGLQKTAAVIDVGGGASTLIDGLLAAGYSDLTVLDLSRAALAVAQARLGATASRVRWLEGDITGMQLRAGAFDLWHDRAVFHFLTEAQQRRLYVERLVDALKPGGHVIIATFADDGPTQCSGLPVMRYDAAQLAAELGERFELVQHQTAAHHTPFGTVQQFTWCWFRFRGT